jgi:hypothetical protein
VEGVGVPIDIKKSDLYIGLEALINETTCQKERECHEYLKSVPVVLLKNRVVIDINSIRCGYATPSGIWDYIVVAKIYDDGGFECNQAYIWELKAPQCFIFEADTANRVKPQKS